MVSGLFQSSWHVRLGPAETAELLALDGAAPFEPMPGRPMTGFTLLPPAIVEDDAAIRALGRTRDRLRCDDAAEGAEAEEGDGVEGRLRATMPDRYWNDALETLAPTTRRRLEDDRLVEQIAYDYATSPFYRASLDAAGVRPDEIRHVEDLARIPFMEKADDRRLAGRRRRCSASTSARRSTGSSASRPPAARPAGRCGSG